MPKKLLCAVLALLLLWQGAALSMTRDELRSAYETVSSLKTDASPYAEEPNAASFFVGSLKREKLDCALAYLNFLRSVAGLTPVSLSELYCLRSQNAALLLAANDAISHSPAQPEGMHPDLYESALLGASLSDLARFNWMEPEILLEGVAYFARDDGDMNLSTQGHRRWLLNPRMAETGFGLANAESGCSYVVMYAVDEGNADAEWDHVAWPSAQAFPVELMRDGLAWSLSLNDEVYDPDASQPVIRLREERSGAEFIFRPDGEGDGFCTLNRESYGAGSCLIFRPELERAGLSEYLQNQRWQVEVSGLILRGGGEASISYVSEMVSLYPQDAVNVELSQTEARLKLGELLTLTAEVIPSYADDLQVSWHSSDPSVAAVDLFGTVCAMGSGSCEIIAKTANGRQDVCVIIVDQPEN